MSLATSKPDGRAGKENSVNTEGKFSLHKYTNQTLIMVVTK